MDNEAYIVFCHCKAAAIRLCTIDSMNPMIRQEFAKLERLGHCTVRLPVNAARLVPFCECPDGITKKVDNDKPPTSQG